MHNVFHDLLFISWPKSNHDQSTCNGAPNNEHCQHFKLFSYFSKIAKKKKPQLFLFQKIKLCENSETWVLDQDFRKTNKECD